MKWTELPADEIIRFYVSERKYSTEIARIYRAGEGTILHLLRKHNIPIRDRNKSRTITVDAKELRRLYIDEHLNSFEVATRLGMTFTTVLHKLRECGIPARDSHNGLDKKTSIDLTSLPSIIVNPRYRHTPYGREPIGDVQCPMCRRTRTLTLSTARAQEIDKQHGRCSRCASKARTSQLDLEAIYRLYSTDHIPVDSIAARYGVSDHTIYAHLKRAGLPIRTKGETHTINYRNAHPNKGTIDSPTLGDIRRGTEVGLLDKSYYVFVQCPECKQTRWQGMSHFKKQGPTCLACAVDPRVNNKGNLIAPIVGDIQRGPDIGRTGRFYTRVACPECHTERWESSCHVAKHPRCRPCAARIMGQNRRREKSPNWRGGRTQQLYPFDFNHRLKQKILKRDHYHCQWCGSVYTSRNPLPCHHIDSNKHNLDERNLVSLCRRCHGRTQFHAEYWQGILSALVIGRYYSRKPSSSHQEPSLIPALRSYQEVA